MPITGPSSFVPTINLFIPHWVAANTALGAGGPLVLPDGSTVSTLTGFRDSLMGFASSLESKLNDVEIARGFIELIKASLHGRINEFNRKIRGFLSHTPYAAALPQVPQLASAQGPFLQPLDDMNSLWTKINAATIPGFTGPLTLLGGYLLATFTTELASLKTAYTTWLAAVQETDIERERRNDVQDLAYAVLRDYRAAVEGTFAPTDALVESLPRLSPEPGSTPDAITANIAWDAVLLKSRITFTASSDPNLSHYELRFCAGPNYSSDNESVIGNLTLAELREFLTDSGLTSPGSTASFKVYVVLTTGNEKGSNTVTLTRP